MPIKIFATPGDYRDDFCKLEEQVNEWLASENPANPSLHCMVSDMQERRDLAAFMLTVVVQYDQRRG